MRTDRHPPQIASVGLPFLIVEIASRDALRRAKPNAAAICADVSRRWLRCGLFLHARRAGCEQPLDLQARMFHPGASGLSEDPATGSATGRPPRCLPISIRRVTAN